MSTDKRSTGVRLDLEAIEALDEMSAQTGKSRSRLIVEAVKLFLKQPLSQTLESELEQIKRRLSVIELKVKILEEEETDEETIIDL